MTDIFISYATEDKARVRPLADALAAEGWTVFWDRKVRAGEIWQEVIGKHLEGARCVLVVWTHLLVLRHWVIEEANEGRDRDVLVPASLDPVKIPFGFKRIQSADLVGWDGDPANSGFQDLISALADKIGQPGARLPEGAGTQDGVTTQQPETAEQAASKPAPASELPASPGNPRPSRRKALSWLLTLSVSLAGTWLAFSLPVTQSTLPPPPRPTARPVAATAAPSTKPAVTANSPQLPDMVRIEAGTFQMGGNGDKDEKPIHRVAIAKPFAIGKYEVTFDEYDRFARATGAQLPEDEGWGRGTRPVIHVSWDDANAYAKWLSERTDKRYRLPTEAEWEYAARAGTTTEHYWGDDAKNNKACTYANVFDRRHARELKALFSGVFWEPYPCDDPFPFTAPVGEFEKNRFELYDMLGNVWEWVADCYQDSYQGAPADGRAWEDGSECRSGQRVLRGGSWSNIAASLRSAFRLRNAPGDRYDNLGFRLAQDIE